MKRSAAVLRMWYEEIDGELDRIGADHHLRRELASMDPGVFPALLLAVLRATPTAGGMHALERTLRTMLEAPPTARCPTAPRSVTLEGP
jgi:hypothetical protein